MLTERQAARLASKGVKLEVKRIGGKAASQVLREQAAAGWTAYRSYSEPGGIRDEIAAVAARYPRLTKVVTIGTDGPGQADSRGQGHQERQADPRRLPPVHRVRGRPARPRVDHGGDDPPADAPRRSTTTAPTPRSPSWSTRPSCGSSRWPTRTGTTTRSPTGNRLWRKNLRDNNGDGQITAGDGVDLNRNFAYKWGCDNEGSSPDPASETYRGPAPNSEPETKALDRLFRRIGFEFFINYHSAAELLLYGVGWQVSTPTPDDEIYKAMAGDDANPAVPGYDPDISAELYTTNGDTDTHMHGALRHARLHPGDDHLPDRLGRPTPTTSGSPRTASAASTSPTTRN